MAHDARAAIDALQQSIVQHLPPGTPLRVLDAGCGTRRAVGLGNKAHVVGLDVSPENLRRNESIDEPIAGDLQTYPLPRASFDVALCWNVLEHLQRPRAALDNMRHALRPGGLLILAGPNHLSMKGLGTWITPYWFHGLCYHLWATGGYESPFKTYRRISTTPRSILKWATTHDITLEYAATYESWLQRAFRTKLGLTGRSWDVLRRGADTATFGAVDLAATEFILLLRT